MLSIFRKVLFAVCVKLLFIKRKTHRWIFSDGLEKLDLIVDYNHFLPTLTACEFGTVSMPTKTGERPAILAADTVA
jgi:hypothetical protein